MAAAFKPSFPRLALSCLEKAQQLIERNVNQKILFADLVNQLYIRV